MVVRKIKALEISRDSEEAKQIMDRYIPRWVSDCSTQFMYAVEDLKYHEEMFSVRGAKLAEAEYILIKTKKP